MRRGPVVLCAVLVMAACSPSGGGDGSDSIVSVTSGPASAEEFPDPAEWARAYGECMREKGWSVTIEGGTVITDDRTPEQRAIAAVDGDACDEEMIAAGIVPDPSRPPSEGQARAIYEELLDYRACLVDNGYPVSEVPSFEAYFDARLNGSGEEGQWNPLALSGGPGDEAMAREAHGVCEGGDSG